MSNSIRSDNIAFVCSKIRGELPLLIGTAAWAEISSSLETKLDQLLGSTSELERLQFSGDLVEMIAPYPAARTRVKGLLEMLDPYNGVLTGMALIARQIGTNEDIIDQLTMAALQATSPQLKLIEIRKGRDKGKSIKLKNLEFDFGDTTGLVASIIGTAASIVGQTNHLLMAAGILLAARTFYEAITIDLSEQEASVFCGFIQTCDTNRTANRDDILKSTNHERKNIGLKPLTKNELKNVLHKLTAIKSIQPVEGKQNMWRIIEKHRIRN